MAVILGVGVDYPSTLASHSRFSKNFFLARLQNRQLIHMKNSGQPVDAVQKQVDAECVKKMLSTWPNCVETMRLPLVNAAESDRNFEGLTHQRFDLTQYVSGHGRAVVLALRARIGDRSTGGIGPGKQDENRNIQH
ncbi:hypothetical protein AB9K34_20700 [Sedimentitalea sp. XS_ASV28]|uniref:hypothetical protein n=1 Tax=Sedimentitalea sp. XS_ASV28 TaxID=3241296 RepID=UPI00351509FC